MSPDFAVIGRGLMGTACAKYLAEAGHSVALIGPDEPKDPARHDGPFGSFHDAGRITRRIAHDPVWAELSTRSIARYDTLEKESGVTFYTPCGGVMAGPSSGDGRAFTAAFLDTSAALKLPHEVLTGTALAKRLPMFAFGPGIRAAFDPAGGVINPRRMRLAHETLAGRAGAKIIPASVTARNGTSVTLDTGETLSAGHIVLATGAYAAAAPLSAAPKMNVYARTILFAEVTEAEAAHLHGMPSLIFWPKDGVADLYLLPPIRYPDGRHYLKIGGEVQSPTLTSDDAARRWFQSAGDASVGVGLLQDLRQVMPGLDIRSTHTGSCAVSFTSTGYPFIALAEDKVTLLTGGNGAGAKCADELGRLGAVLATGGALSAEGYVIDFGAEFCG